MTTSLARLCIAAASIGAAALPLAMPAAPAAAIPVFDAGNHAQNLLQAARALEQINNQIRSLQNEAAMLRNMDRNLERIDFPQLDRIRAGLQRVEQLMGEARALDYRVENLDAHFRRLFPDQVDPALGADARVSAARERFGEAMAGFRHAMAVQSQVVTNLAEDAAMLDALGRRSDGAVGSLQAQQATNQLLVLAAKQQLQLQQLMASEFRSQATERARRAQSEAEAHAATRRFLGSGKAYSPR